MKKVLDMKDMDSIRGSLYICMGKIRYLTAFLLIYLMVSCTCNNSIYAELDCRISYKNGGSVLTVTYYSLTDKSLSFAKADLNGKTYTLPQVVSADGVRFTDGKSLSIWLKGDKLFVEEFKDGEWSQRVTYDIEEMDSPVQQIL